jgi:quercetin dioxygenase-like cupin family protein
MKKLLILAGLIALAGSALAQDAMKGIVVKPDALTWKENPALPKGFQTAAILGDPTKTEVVVQRVKFPPNSQIAPHTHPYAEVVTVISGTVGTDEGEKLEKKGEMLKAGSVFTHGAKHAHYAWTGNEEAIVQVQYTGPAGIDYINPADDPRKKTQ